MSVAIDVSAVHPRSGGAGTYVHGLIGALPRAGIEPVLVARRSDSPSRWPGSGEFVRVAPSLRPLRLLWEQTGLVRALRRAAPDVGVLHSPHYTMPEHLSRRDRLRLARVVTVHDLTFFTRPQDHQPAKRMLFRRAIAKAAADADAIVCVSEATAALLQEHAPPRCPVHVIRHGIDHNRFTAAVAANDSEILRRLAVTVPFILHLGTIEPRKNVHNLLRAYEIICAQSGSSTPAELVLAGGAWPGAWDALEVPTVGRVRRLGFVAPDDLPALLRAAGVVAYPSFEEGFGMPVVEALACGAPVVTSEATVMAELAAGAALLADPRDPVSIAAAITSALSGDGPRLEARLGCASTFTWTACAAAHADVYRSLGAIRS